MSVRRIKWAVNLPDGTPVIFEGALGDVDDKTGIVALTSRSKELIEEVLQHDPQATEAYIVPSVDLAHEVHRLVRAKRQAGIPLDAPLPQEIDAQPIDGDLPSDTDGIIAPPTQAVIDQTLRLLHGQSFRFQQKLGQSPNMVSTSELRASPVGSDLMRLARIANGDEAVDFDIVLSMIDSVLELLFWPAGEDQYQVPRSFWEEPLGKMLSQAKLRAVDPSELMSIGNAAQQLGVTRPTIYRWMDDQTLNYVRDEMSGRTFLLRREIEELKQGAAQLSPKHTLHGAEPFSVMHTDKL